jgi:hypothetical protein
MRQVSKISIMLIAIVIAAIYLPLLYDMMFSEKIYRSFIQYSAINNKFMIRKFKDHDVAVGMYDYDFIYQDEDGRLYDKIAYEKLLPFTNYHDLIKWDALPSRIKGEKITVKKIKKNTQYFMIYPDDIHSPQIDIYPLFESASMFTKFEYPASMFRMNTRMEFIRAAENAVDEKLSTSFTRALTREGFVFPARQIAGNPDTRKPFDEGYFVIDNRNTLFHIKMISSKPFVKNTGISFEKDICYMEFSENSRKEFYGYVVTGDNKVCLLSYDDYQLIPLPLAHYNPHTMRLLFRADPLHRSIVYQDDRMMYCVVTDRAYRVVRTYQYQLEDRENTTASRICKALFPFSIKISSSTTSYVPMIIDFNGYSSLLGIGLALLMFIAYCFFRSAKLKREVINCMVICVTGVYGLLAVLVFGKE